MTAFFGLYQSDLGADFELVTLFTNFRLEEGFTAVPDEEPLLPESFINAVQRGSGPCLLRVVPRRALIVFSDVLSLEVPIPFRGGTASYSQMLSELEEVDGAREFRILPEEISTYQVNLQLLT